MISMPRRRLLYTSSAAVITLLVIATHGQTLSPGGSVRTVLSNFAPPAVQQGLDPDTSHWPGSPEMQERRAAPQLLAAGERVNAFGARYMGDRVIVKFRDGVTAASRESAVSAVTPRGSMAPRSAWQNFDVVQMAGTDDAETAAASYRTRAEVEYAQAAYRVQTDQASVDRFVPDDRFYPAQWDLQMMDLGRVWKIQPAAGSAITVAVLDTGIAFTDRTMEFTAGAFCENSAHYVLAGSCPTGDLTQYPALGRVSLAFAHATELEPLTRFVAPHDFIWDDELPVDLNFHGTHVAGTLGQLTNNAANGQGDTANGGGTAGVAFNIKLMPVKVVSTEWDAIFGAPNQGTDYTVALGIRYAVDNGAKVINMSLGRTGPAGCGGNPNLNGCAPVVEDAMRYAVCAGAKSSTCSGAGAFIAVAAGNDFLNGNPVGVYAEIASRVSGAVSVAAVNKAQGHASVLEHRELRRDRGAWRRRWVVQHHRHELHPAADPQYPAGPDLHAAGGPVRAAELRQLWLLLRRRHLASRAAHRRRGRDADAAGHHRPCGGGIRARAVRDAVQRVGRSVRRRTAGDPHVDVRVRPGRRQRRIVRTGAGQVTPRRLPLFLAAVLIVGGRAVPALAQNARPVSFKPFFVVTAEGFAADKSFDAIFGGSVQPLFGGGLEVTFKNRFFVDLTVLHFSKTGERSIVLNGQVFHLGIPLKATLTPIEVSAGYRFAGHARRVVPYIGAGVGSYGVSQESDLAAAGDNVDARHVGYLVAGGAEIRVGQWLGLSGDLQYTHVPGILGKSGISQHYGEDDLGGLSVRFRVLVGR